MHHLQCLQVVLKGMSNKDSMCWNQLRELCLNVLQRGLHIFQQSLCDARLFCVIICDGIARTHELIIECLHKVMCESAFKNIVARCIDADQVYVTPMCGLKAPLGTFKVVVELITGKLLCMTSRLQSKGFSSGADLTFPLPSNKEILVNSYSPGKVSHISQSSAYIRSSCWSAAVSAHRICFSR